jgi:hypothetical protein
MTLSIGNGKLKLINMLLNQEQMQIVQDTKNGGIFKLSGKSKRQEGQGNESERATTVLGMEVKQK